ncbi:MAG: SIS domain-containing protein [Desulfobacterales bacterium]|nr:SIS domain-containing protein [Desulfobacterales bacterium]
MVIKIRSLLKQIRSWFYRKCFVAINWRIRFGCNPNCLSSNTIVFFPVIPNTLCCGLAGILTIVRKDPTTGSEIFRNLSAGFKEIRAYGMHEFLSRSISAENYLGGSKKQNDFENFVFGLKQDAVLEILFFQKEACEHLSNLSNAINSFLLKEEDLIEKNANKFSTVEMEYVNNALTRVKDVAWALDRDLLSNLEKINYLSGLNEKEKISNECFRKYRKINLLLNAVDRIEVRGRDSAGIQIAFTLEDRIVLDDVIKKLKNLNLYEDFIKRLDPGDLSDGCIHLSDQHSGCFAVHVTFTYKKASVTGELGENTRYLRDRIRSDRILQIFAVEPIAFDTYMAHTRWASVGSITEENCHPINNFVLNENLNSDSRRSFQLKEYPYYGRGNWSIDVALNGDIDNYGVLRSAVNPKRATEIIAKSVTTDTKIIPLQIEQYLFKGYDLKEAFRSALNDFEGSHAISMQSNLEPGKVFLALKGSGQSLYIGMCDDQYMYSSEVYGLVELTPHFMKLDGENERIPGNSKTKGQIVVLNSRAENSLEGVCGFYYDGHPLKITAKNIKRADITTRDIDRKNYPHFLLKEIEEAPLSVKKTLRGKYFIEPGPNGQVRVNFNLGRDIITQRLQENLANGSIDNIFVIGQGTAAVAGAAIADAIAGYLSGSKIKVQAIKASELSGFYLSENLNNTLVIAVTQSGTTTDTNRAVAMAKERGAHLMAIVNRRQSDITHNSEGVFYTSDGRDIEMSVASTKAFYSQIIAGYILALNFAQMLGTMSDEAIAKTLAAMEKAPHLMHNVLSSQEGVKKSAWDIVKRKKYWAVVGSGPNKVAADEIRIKLSELCYKTISSDIVEDKKHIDLSSEPLILVCTAGNPKSVLDDIVKDVAIFKSHAADAIVIADQGETGFDTIADSVISVPRADFPTSVILNTLVGHLWGYYAACSINEESNFFRNFRTELSLKISEQNKTIDTIFEKIADTSLHKIIERFSAEFHTRKNRDFFATISVGLATDIVLLLKYAIGKLPLEDFWEDFKEKRTSSSPLDLLDICLGRAVDELSRPIDAIRHQAKTVTVGTSRKVEMLQGVLFDLLKRLNFSLENLTTKDGMTARRLQTAISEIKGHTLYAIGNLNENGKPTDKSTIAIAQKGGVALQMKSRVEQSGLLRGTKKTIVNTGDIYAGLGKTDRASIIIIPLLGEGSRITHLLLAHVAFNQELSVKDKKEVLGDKTNKIVDLVNEYNLTWNDDYFEKLPIEFLLDQEVGVIASKIITSLRGTS